MAETEQKLINIFLSLSDGERTIEISRQVLSDIFDFDCLKIFQALDSQEKNYIDASDLVNYFNSKEISISDVEAQLIILFYDQNFDGVLSFEEFNYLIQSENSHKKFYRDKNITELSFNIDYSLSKLLLKELQLSRNILELLKKIQSSQDFNIHSLYHLVKSCNGITAESIKNFLDKNKICYLESDIENILKRIDLNKDGKIDFCEFHAFLGFPNCCYCCPCIACNFCGACYCEHCFCNDTCHCHGCVHRSCNSPLRKCNSNICSPEKNKKVLNNNEKNNLNENYKTVKYQNEDLSDKTKKLLTNPNLTSQNSTMFNSKTNFNNFSNIKDDNIISTISPKRKFFEKISNSLSLRKSPERKYKPNCYESNFSPSKYPYEKNINSNDLINSTKLVMNYNPNAYEENQFNDFLKNIMLAESAIENEKISLSLKKDFNCEDAFRIFLSSNQDYLTENDLRNGLNLIGIFPTDDDIKLLMKRFDLKKRGNLNYADFFDMIIPFEVENRDMVENRVPNSCCPCRCPDIFCNDTISTFKNLMNIIINYENKFNIMRKGFTSLNLKLKELFGVIDCSNMGFFTNNELLIYLQKKGLFTNNRDADLLFIRLDKNRNGKIDYQEIYDEFHPLY